MPQNQSGVRSCRSRKRLPIGRCATSSLECRAPISTVERRALTRASGPDDLLIDFTLVMKGFEFDTVWNERRTFTIEGVQVPTARLLHIVTSKQAAGRPKDQYFLATHKDALEQLFKKPDAG